MANVYSAGLLYLKAVGELLKTQKLTPLKNIL